MFSPFVLEHYTNPPDISSVEVGDIQNFVNQYADDEARLFSSYPDPQSLWQKLNLFDLVRKQIDLSHIDRLRDMLDLNPFYIYANYVGRGAVQPHLLRYGTILDGVDSNGRNIPEVRAYMGTGTTATYICQQNSARISYLPTGITQQWHHHIENDEYMTSIDGEFTVRYLGESDEEQTVTVPEGGTIRIPTGLWHTVYNHTGQQSRHVTVKGIVRKFGERKTSPQGSIKDIPELICCEPFQEMVPDARSELHIATSNVSGNTRNVFGRHFSRNVLIVPSGDMLLHVDGNVLDIKNGGVYVGDKPDYVEIENETSLIIVSGDV